MDVGDPVFDLGEDLHRVGDGADVDGVAVGMELFEALGAVEGYFIEIAAGVGGDVETYCIGLRVAAGPDGAAGGRILDLCGREFGCGAAEHLERTNLEKIKCPYLPRSIITCQQIPLALFGAQTDGGDGAVGAFASVVGIVEGTFASLLDAADDPLGNAPIDPVVGDREGDHRNAPGCISKAGNI